MSEASTQSSREYDLIVWGATGFTGTLVCEYLCARSGAEDGLRWAIAGRSQKKLDELKRRLGPAGAQLTTLVADSLDANSLLKLVTRARVVATTVGPYALYGSLLVEACAKSGTDYCDLSGEVPWMRRMIDQYESVARSSGARIIHCCGFDSIPSDMGVWWLQNTLKNTHNTYAISIDMLVCATKGGASGGTIASGVNAMQETLASKEAASIMSNPYSLNPKLGHQGKDQVDQRGMRHNKSCNQWTAPFIMAGINTRVVRRSHALGKFPYGAGFTYNEAVLTGRGLVGAGKAALLTAALGAFGLALVMPWGRKFLLRFVLPTPGQGPSPEAREQGFFDLRFYATLPNGQVIQAKVSGDRDPGYGSTSKMLAECAICLAKDDIQVPGGFSTPSVAMGSSLFKRLGRNAGLTFEQL